MKRSEPPALATRLLEMIASAPHGDALAGDLIEQYRQGRSRAWYWRQVFSALAVCLARDRTLGGLALLAWLYLLFLIVASVSRHPASLGFGLLATDLGLLSGYAVLSVWVLRQRNATVRSALTAGARSGILLGLVLIMSHATEWFELLDSRPVALVRGIGSILLMLALLSTAASVAWQRTRSGSMALMSAFWGGAIAASILLSFAFTLNFAFESQASVWLHGAFAASGMSDPGAFVVRNALESASEVLIRIPVAALLMSVGAILSNTWISRWPRSLTLLAGGLTPLLFLSGLTTLWHADSLMRIARPPFIMSGLMMVAMALCGAHPLWAYLFGKHRPAINRV